MAKVIQVKEENETKELFSPRQRLTVKNDTSEFYRGYGRKLKLIWSGDTHEGESLESLLEPGQEDTKKSERTNNANFIVEIFREKNGEWIPSGSFSEYVTTNVDDGSHEKYALEATYNAPNLVRLYRQRFSDIRDRELINEFLETEW